MDKMDRNWELFQNRFKSPFQNGFQNCLILVRKVVDLYERRFLMRISGKVVYYLVVASLAYYFTRESGDYYAHQNLGIETDVFPPFQYKFVWAVVVFFIFITISI